MKDIAKLKEQLLHFLAAARKEAPIIFIVFLVAIYGFLVFRISYLLGTEPSDSAVSSQLQSVGIPKVDPDVVNKMEQLKNNNVSVQAIFDNARDNPFQE